MNMCSDKKELQRRGRIEVWIC